MANDIEITVKVANQTNTGFGQVNTALGRVKANAQQAGTALRTTATRAGQAGTAMTALGQRARAAGQGLNHVQDQARGAQRTLAELKATSGDLRLKATLDDRTGPGVAAVKAALRGLKAESPVRLRATFDGQAGDITAAAQAMRSLKNDAQSAGNAVTALGTKSAAAARALESLKDNAQSASRAVRGLGVNAAAAAVSVGELRDRVRSLSTALRTLDNRAGAANTRLGDLGDRSRVLRGDLDGLNDSTARLGGSLRGLRGGVGGLGSLGRAAGSSGMNMKTLGAIALAVLAGITVAAPIAAAAVTTTLPIAFGALGAFALKSNAEVKSAFADMKSSVGADIRAAAEPFKPFLIDAMGEVTDGVKELKGPLSDAFRAAGPLIDDVADGLIGLGKRALPGITQALQRSGPMMQQFSEFLGQVGDGIGGMFEAITAGNDVQLAKVWSNMGTGIRDTLVAFGRMLGTLTANEDAVESVAVAFELLTDTIEAVTDVTDALAPAFLAALQVIDGGMQQVSFWTDVFTNFWDVLSGGKDDPAAKIVTAATATKKLGDAAGAAQGPSNLFAGAADRAKVALEGQKESADALRGAIQALNDVQRAGLGGMIGFEAAIDAAAKGAREYADTLSMSGGKLDLNGEKARSAAQLLADLAAKTDEAAGSARESGESWAHVNGIYERGRQKLVAAAVQMGLTREQARLLAGQILKTPDKTAKLKGNAEDLKAKIRDAERRLKSVPDSRKAKVRAEIAGLKRQLREAQAAINRLHGKTIYSHHYLTKHFTTIETFRAAHGRATGGPVGQYSHAAEGGPRGNQVLVGEEGPEIVDLAPGSMVHTAGATRRMMQQQGGGGREPIVLELRSSGSRLDDLLVEILRNAIHARGGNPVTVLSSRGR